MKPVVIPERHTSVSSKIKTYLLGLLAVATVCTGLIAWNQAQQIKALQAALDESRAKASAPRPRPNPPPAEATPPAAVASAPTPAKADPIVIESSSEESAPGRPRGRGNFATLMSDPDFAKAMNLQQRALLDSRYAELFKQLNLSPAALEKLKDLLVERQNARMDVMTAARESGLNPRENPGEIRRLTAEAQAEVDSNIKASLGESVYEQYKAYEATQPQRAIVNQIDQRLSYSGTPLTSAQSEFLINAFSGSGQTSDPAPGPGGVSNGGRARITDDVIQKAQSVLAPDQLVTLKQLKEEQDAQDALRDRIRNSGGSRN